MDKLPKFNRRIQKLPNIVEDWEDDPFPSHFYEPLKDALNTVGIDLLDKNLKLLEIGSGNAGFLDILKEKGVNVVGVDIDPRGKQRESS